MTSTRVENHGIVASGTSASRLWTLDSAIALRPTSSWKRPVPCLKDVTSVYQPWQLSVVRPRITPSMVPRWLTLLCPTWNGVWSKLCSTDVRLVELRSEAWLLKWTLRERERDLAAGISDTSCWLRILFAMVCGFLPFEDRREMFFHVVYLSALRDSCSIYLCICSYTYTLHLCKILSVSSI